MVSGRNRGHDALDPPALGRPGSRAATGRCRSRRGCSRRSSARVEPEVRLQQDQPAAGPQHPGRLGQEPVDASGRSRCSSRFEAKTTSNSPSANRRQIGAVARPRPVTCGAAAPSHRRRRGPWRRLDGPGRCWRSRTSRRPAPAPRRRAGSSGAGSRTCGARPSPGSRSSPAGSRSRRSHTCRRRPRCGRAASRPAGGLQERWTRGETLAVTHRCPGLPAWCGHGPCGGPPDARCAVFAALLGELVVHLPMPRS